MNPKIALFLSATLTAFVVATLSGVVNKVTSVSASNATPVQAVVQQVATATLEQPTDLPAPTSQQPLGPEQAATLAAEAVNRQDVYSVETSTYNNVDAYKVVFSSGDVVYIGMDSLVLAKTKLQPAVVNVQATKPPKKNRNNGGDSQASNSQPSNNGGDNGGGDHEGGD
jgi:uncharacterized membrane protein YgcG